MARASVTPAVLETTTIVVEPEVVTLTLSPEEATALRDVCRRIGGDPLKSRRRYFDAIGRALSRAGVEGSAFEDHDVDESPRPGSIFFITPTN